MQPQNAEHAGQQQQRRKHGIDWQPLDLSEHEIQGNCSEDEDGRDDEKKVTHPIIERRAGQQDVCQREYEPEQDQYGLEGSTAAEPTESQAGHYQADDKEGPDRLRELGTSEKNGR